MIDNQTTELLHKLLRERGIEYTTDDDERAYDMPARTTWDFVLCGLEMTVTATEFVDVEGKTYLEMDFHHAFTPEQSIAATLGSWREKALEELVRDLLQLRCRQSCVDCEHEDDEGCDFMTRALELEIEVYR